MDDKTKTTAVWVLGVVGMTFAAVLYQGLVVTPQQALAQQEKTRLDGIQYSNEQKADVAVCLKEADTDYWSWIDLNMTKKDDGTYWGSTYNWNTAASNKKTAQDACYRQY